MELECLVDFGGTAEWRRRKAREYPNDRRNEAAAELLERLADELSNFEGSEDHRLLEAAIRLLPEEELHVFGEKVSDELRSIGFSSFPDSATSVVRSLAWELSS